MAEKIVYTCDFTNCPTAAVYRLTRLRERSTDPAAQAYMAQCMQNSSRDPEFCLAHATAALTDYPAFTEELRKAREKNG